MRDGVPVRTFSGRSAAGACESNYRSGGGKVFLWLSSPVPTIAMRSRCKIFLSAILRVLVAFAIAIAIANMPAFAQGSKATVGAQSASAAPSVVATGAPQPGAAASPAAAGAVALDAHSVIAYLTDVINWYGHLGTEAQLVRDPDETLFFANDRQTAGELLRLAFESPHAQAAVIAKTAPPAGAIATGNSVSASAGL